MVLVNVKFNWFWIIYIQNFENNNVIEEIFDILTFQFRQLELQSSLWDSKFESQVHWRNKCGRYKSVENSVMCKYELIYIEIIVNRCELRVVVTLF